MSTILQTARSAPAASPSKMAAVAPYAPNRPAKPERTQITPAYQSPTDGSAIHKQKTSPKLQPIAHKASPDILHQYNDIIGPNESLTFKRLPSVKISYHTKNKFVETLKGDTSSKILRPHLTLKTTSPGHHIFTEGISRSSEIPDPTFALQKIHVPYSNLPDNISIYKEKNKFMFGVKKGDVETENKSPYRLTHKPLALGSAQIITDIVMDKKIDRKKSSSKTTGEKSTKSVLGMKTNVIKLEPITGRDKQEVIPHPPVSSPEHEWEPVVVPGTDRSADSQPEVHVKGGSRTDPQNTETMEDRRLSVVSIGMHVSEDLYQRDRRETRNSYPMYDHTARKLDKLKKDTFERESITSKPKLPSSTFNYKVNTRGLTFVHDTASDKFKPIRNNLRDRYGNLIHKQRGLYKPGLERETSKASSDYNFRRYYTQGYSVPKSAGSTCTDMTHVPGNPPPSIISQDEGTTVVVNVIKNGMLTLFEERTMTESRLSNSKDQDKQRESDRHHVNSANENAEADNSNLPLTNRSKAMTMTGSVSTDTEFLFQVAMKHQNADVTQDNNRKTEVDTQRRSSSRGGSSVYQYIAEAEKRVKESRMTNKTNKTDNSQGAENNNEIGNTKHTSEAFKIDREKYDKAVKQNVKTKLHHPDEFTKEDKVSVPSNSKQLFSVPKVFDASFAPNPSLGKERTSLSRNLQNMTVAVTELNRDQGESAVNESIDKTAKIRNGDKATVHVTRLQLFSESSSGAEKLPSLCLTNEHDETHVIYDIDSVKKTLADEDSNKGSDTSRKVICNATVPFIYPSTSDVKAKRQ